MTIELNHTIVYSRDKRVSSDFLAGLFGLPSPVAWGPFLAIGVANRVTLDFLDADGEIATQHYLLVGEEDSTRSSGVSRREASRTGPTLATTNRARSTPTTAAGASTSMTRAGTSSRSSRGRTARLAARSLRWRNPMAAVG
jgi:hypothetical protein